MGWGGLAAKKQMRSFENTERTQSLWKREILKMYPPRKNSTQSRKGLETARGQMKNLRWKNEVMNERRERENKWEDWAGLEQEIDELGSGGEEEGKKRCTDREMTERNG